MSSTSYTVEKIPVSQLQVDPRVQRDGLNTNKVAAIERNFNEDALGIITVSRRRDVGGVVGDFIIDGWHRVEACKRKDSEFEVVCHVFEGLTVPEEAFMFLDLNNRTAVTQLDKYKVLLSGEDPTAMLIESTTRARGWKVDVQPAPGHIQAVQALYRIHNLSMKVNADPHLIDATLFVITRAWGNDRYAAQAVIMEGIANVIAEYGDRVNLVTLSERLRDRKGGPRELHANASQLANTRNGRVVNAVSELVVIHYNKTARSRALHPWRRVT